MEARVSRWGLRWGLRWGARWGAVAPTLRVDVELHAPAVLARVCTAASAAIDLYAVVGAAVLTGEDTSRDLLAMDHSSLVLRRR